MGVTADSKLVKRMAFVVSTRLLADTGWRADAKLVADTGSRASAKHVPSLMLGTSVDPIENMNPVTCMMVIMST